ncbi:hypothetical protein ABW21_db0200375 [Orbilia brochopaga]|nr:hypothetical protein ABW21_db0200375 [Drechslerella brochopaga]
MAARSSAAQKSLMRAGASREPYASYQYTGAPVLKHQSYLPADAASSSSGSSQEFQHPNDIDSFKYLARPSTQAEEAYHRGRSASTSRSVSSRGHGKNSSNGGNEVLENVFGIYPEKKSMGTGVSVADVVANKLFKWGSKKEAPSGIPTPSRESNVPAPRPSRPHPAGYVGGYPQPSNEKFLPSFHRQEMGYVPAQRDEVVQPQVPTLDQNKLDELMARQKMLEDRINQLKLERDYLLDVNQQPPVHKVHNAPIQVQYQQIHPHQQQYMGYPLQPAPLRIPSTSSQPRSPPDISPTRSVSSSIQARQFVEASLQFPMPPQSSPQPSFSSRSSSSGPNSPARGRSSRAMPMSKPSQPMRTTSPMSIPSSASSASSARQEPSAASAHYVSRPLPQPPNDATPPPEYEPPESFGSHRHTASSYRDVKLRLIPATSGAVSTQDVILEEPHLMEDEKDIGNAPSPRDDVDAEDIIGWFETLKFSSNSTRGRAAMSRPAADQLSVPYDVKLPLKDTSPTDRFDMKYSNKDWKTGRQKRSQSRLREQAREAEAQALRLAAV